MSEEVSDEVLSDVVGSLEETCDDELFDDDEEDELLDEDEDDGGL